jgi:hypothetical protein
MWKVKCVFVCACVRARVVIILETLSVRIAPIETWGAVQVVVLYSALIIWYLSMGESQHEETQCCVCMCTYAFIVCVCVCVCVCMCTYVWVHLHACVHTATGCVCVCVCACVCVHVKGDLYIFKMWEIAWQAERLPASEEGPCCLVLCIAVVCLMFVCLISLKLWKDLSNLMLLDDQWMCKN